MQGTHCAEDSSLPPPPPSYFIGSMFSCPAPRHHVGVSIASLWQIRYDERHDGEVTDEWKRLQRCLVLLGILWCLPCVQLFALGSYLYPMKRSTYAILCTIRRYLLVTPRTTREFTRVKGHPLDGHDDYLSKPSEISCAAPIMKEMKRPLEF